METMVRKEERRTVTYERIRMQIVTRIHGLSSTRAHNHRSQSTTTVSLSLTMRQLQLPKSVSWSDPSNVDTFQCVGSRPNVHCTVGENLFNRVRSFHCGLELVRESEVHLLPHFITNRIVMSNPLGVFSHQSLVNHSLSVVSYGKYVRSVGNVQKHVSAEC